MNSFPEILHTLPIWLLCCIFLVENIVILLGVLICGNRLQRKPSNLIFAYTSKQFTIASVTCLLNTIFTYIGYWTWKQGYITISTDFSVWIIIDTLLLLIAMDLLMYIFHYLIHKTFVYKLVHQLHHEATDPEPIDLFILHPLETVGFASLWFSVLILFSLNIYSIIFFSLLNILFGMIGHLSMEPLSEKTRRLFFFRYIGSSTFHHNHHKDEQHNFGFYTNIWDRFFGTYTTSP